MFPAGDAELLRSAVVFLMALSCAVSLRWLLLRWMRRRASATTAPLAILAHALRWPLLLSAITASVVITLISLKLDLKYFEKPIQAVVVVCLTLLLADVTAGTLSHYGEKQRMPFLAAGLSKTLVHVLIWSVGIAVLLATFDLKVTPLLTALGVGGLAVALALQDTLANFFAGIHILVEEPISVGHFIRLSSNEEGVVTDIGWRTTRVSTGGNNTIVIPNTKITSSILINYSLPDERLILDIPVIVGRDADPDRVMEIALQAAHSVGRILDDPPPRIYFDPGILPTHLQFKLEFAVADRTGSGQIKSDIRLAMLRQFRAQGVPLPGLEQIAAAQTGAS
ncbi:MAG: mechanosensitive ion channel family protein [Bryobacteraceae bacterium]|nr:mechanosensitive ion channel family protein [Bryobacteraceae bacterium]